MIDPNYKYGWKDISSAPKDGTLIQGLDNRIGFSLFRCSWIDGEWRGMEFKNIERPTYWRDNDPKNRKLD